MRHLVFVATSVRQHRLYTSKTDLGRYLVVDLGPFVIRYNITQVDNEPLYILGRDDRQAIIQYLLQRFLCLRITIETVSWVKVLAEGSQGGNEELTVVTS